MSTIEPPNVRLYLRNRPENLSLVRAMLAGVGEAIDLHGEGLDDIRMATTEACNNVVLHAYGGDEGPLEVDVHIAETVVEVAVRDEGIGISPEAHTVDKRDGAPATGKLDDRSLELGLPLIQALSDYVEFWSGVDGGTEVRMKFVTPGIRPLQVGPGDGFELPRFEPPLLEFFTGGQPELIVSAAIAITPDRLARKVLPRLVGALAARASFSTGRLSDAQLLADVVAAQAFRTIIGSHLSVGIAVEPRQVELRIGPLPADHAGPVTNSVLGKLGPMVEALIDGHSLATAGSRGVLALHLIDRR